MSAMERMRWRIRQDEEGTWRRTEWIEDDPYEKEEGYREEERPLRGTGQNRPRKKKKRRHARWILSGILALLLGIAVFFALTIRITDIEVTGSTRYTDEELISRIFPTDKERNTLYTFWNEKFGTKQDIPFVEKYQVQITGLHSARITVYEKSLAGCLEYMGSYLYFDKDGIIVESSGQRDLSVPLITGLQFHNVILYEKLTVDDDSVFRVILNLSQLLSGKGISVDKVNFASDGTITLYSGGIEAVLGTSQYLAEKVSEFGDMLPKLEGRSGTVYLDGYSPDAKNPSYPFIEKAS